VLFVDSVRADGFGRRQFIEKSGLGTVELESYQDTTAQCDMMGCRIQLKDKVVSVIKEPEGVMQACRDSDFVVLTQRIAGPVARWKCDVPLIDARVLEIGGALDVRIVGNTIETSEANPERRRARPWGR